ncbi:MAG: hypothetical protein ACE5HX_11320, partial [bacterium]
MIFRKLRTRMIAHIIWIVAVVIFVAFYFVYNLQQKSIQQHLHDDAVTIADIVENVLVKVMQHEGPAALNELLPEFSKLHHIKKIRIIHPDGRISFSSETQEKGKFLQQKNFADFISTPSEVLAYYIKEGKHTNYLKWRKLVNKTRCQKCHDASQKFNGF